MTLSNVGVGPYILWMFQLIAGKGGGLKRQLRLEVSEKGPSTMKIIFFYEWIPLRESEKYVMKKSCLKSEFTCLDMLYLDVW